MVFSLLPVLPINKRPINIRLLRSFAATTATAQSAVRLERNRHAALALHPGEAPKHRPDKTCDRQNCHVPSGSHVGSRPPEFSDHVNGQATSCTHLPAYQPSSNVQYDIESFSFIDEYKAIVEEGKNLGTCTKTMMPLHTPHIRNISIFAKYVVCHGSA